MIVQIQIYKYFVQISNDYSVASVMVIFSKVTDTTVDVFHDDSYIRMSNQAEIINKVTSLKIAAK